MINVLPAILQLLPVKPVALLTPTFQEPQTVSANQVGFLILPVLPANVKKKNEIYQNLNLLFKKNVIPLHALVPVQEINLTAIPVKKPI